MDEEEIIERIKTHDIDPKTTKKYMKIIQQYMSRLKDETYSEKDREVILSQFLSEYDEEMKRDKYNGSSTYYKMLQYKAYQNLLKLNKKNQHEFSKIVSDARKQESMSNEETLNNALDSKEEMTRAIRSIIRLNPKLSETEIIKQLQCNKGMLSKWLKERLIKDIQRSISFLNDLGFIDENIEEANSEYRKLGLGELQIIKRNPLPDEQYDKKGNKTSNDEDIGMLDSFSDEYLEKLTPEDLLLMETFWNSRYLQELLEMSKAMFCIRQLDLSKQIVDGNEQNIDEISDTRIDASLRSELALTYMGKSKTSLTESIKERYNKFLADNQIQENSQLQESVNENWEQTESLRSLANDVALAQCLIIHGLKAKDFNIKSWGVIGNDSINDLDIQDGEKIVAIDDRNFRGTLLMSVTENLLKQFFGDEDIKLPQYKATESLDETYCSIMSKFYLPTNEFYKKTIEKALEKDPHSKLLANLNGKPEPKTNHESQEL